MNLPVKNHVVRNLYLEELEPVRLFLDLEKKEFTGFLSLIVDGKFGFEESYIIFENGSIVGAIFIMPEYDVELYGEKAFQYCLNDYGAKQGILNIYELSDDQLKLVLLFNEDINFVKKVNAEKYKKNKKHFLKRINYSIKYLKKLLKDKVKKEKSKKEILDQRGLDELLNTDLE